MLDHNIGPTTCRKVDLHLHTIASEGQLTLANQFAYASGSGLRAIAIADLDILTDGVEAGQLALQYNVEYLPAVEITAGWQGYDLHILGYGIDIRNAHLTRKLLHIRTAREAHVQIMLYKLNKAGVAMRLDDIRRESPEPFFLSSIHIARAMTRKGLVSSPREAFTSRLIGVDGECYHPSYSLTAQEVIELIVQASGVPVIAHPALHNHHAGIVESDILAFREAGLQGIEVWHSCHSQEATAYYLEMARRYGLLATGGSACRGANYDPIVNYKVVVGDDALNSLVARQVAA